MGTYVLTGGATGIGAAIKEKLRAQGHRVVVIDLKEGDYLADLGDPETRSSVVSKVADEVPEIDGLITCAGVASQFPNTGKILAINYFGTTEVIEGLSANVVTGGRIIAISSNSAPMSTRPDLIDALLDGPEAAAVAMGAELNGHECYASSKNAVARYMRRTAPILAQRGISFNALAPGYISTPMTQAVENDEEYGPLIKAFVDSIPLGRPGQADDVANLAMFLLSPEGAYVAGSTLFIDGAHDAMMRPDVSV
jgi:NAD(P)-dependent dehydrogenase (short-subunit alcohol dehydrogenase family)